MTEPSSAPDLDEAILLQFQREYEAADDKDAVLRGYCERHAPLAPRLRARAAMLPVLGGLEPEQTEALPERFGEFRVLRQIGRGGMGRVYEARDERLNRRRVAVKTIRPDRASPGAIDRFRREQCALARLHQTHIVSIFKAGEEGPVHYFAIPYIDGAALSHVVQTALHSETSGPRARTPSLAKLAAHLAAQQEEAARGSTAGALSGRPVGALTAPALSPEAHYAKLELTPGYFRSVAEAIADAADAIQHAHDAGLLHRDVKPSNLMVDRNGHCWLIDFGLAGAMHSRSGDAAAADPLLASEPITVTGVPGTPQYMAPEQWEGETGIDARTDVYGLGVTLYELLTLRRAFDGESIEAIRKNVLAAKPLRIEELTTNVPADLAAICRWAMRKQAAERYATAAEVAADLRRWLGHEPTRARPVWLLWRAAMWSRRNPGWAAMLVVTFVGSLFLSVLAYVAEARSAEAASIRAAAAEATTEVERERAEAAEERARQQRRETLLLTIQRLQLGTHDAGWFGDAWALVRETAKRGIAGDLRDQAAATLAGLDAVPDKALGSHAGSLAYSPDGKRLVLGGVGKFAGVPAAPGGVYDRTTDRFTASEQPGEPSDGPVAFASDGTPLQLVGTDAYTLRLWDVDRQRKVREFALAAKLPSVELTESNVPAMALSVDGTLVAASTSLPDGKPTLVVWDATTGKVVSTAERKATALAFTPDRATLAVGGETGNITLHDVKTGKVVTSLPGDRLRVHTLAFTRDPLRRRKGGRDASGWLLAVGEAGGGITIWDVERKQARTRCLGSAWDVYGLAFSPDGTLLASAGRNNPRLWDAASGQLLLKLPPQSYSYGVAFTPDGQFLATSALPLFRSPGGVDVYALDYGRGIQTLRGLRGRVEHACRSPDDRYLAALSDDWQLGVWDLKTGQLLHIFEAPVGLFSDNAAIALSADNRLVCASWREARMWDVVTGKELHDPWPLPPGLECKLAFHSSGKLLLFRTETEDMKHSPDSGASPNKHPRVCRVRDLLAKDPTEPLFKLPDFNWHVYEAAFAADGSCFVVNGVQGLADKRVYHFAVYDGLAGKRLWGHEYQAKKGEVADVEIEATGKLLSFQLPSQIRETVVEVTTGRFRGSGPGGGTLGAGGEWWLTEIPSDHLYPSGKWLYRAGEKDPLITLRTDPHGSGSRQPFNAAGTQLTWGNDDGTVTVYDIPEIRKRLATVGLGW